MPTPSTWQSSSILLKRAGDPEFSSTTITSSINASTTTVTVANASAAGIVVGKLIQVDSEKMRVTAVSTNTLTVTRGVEGTTAASHASNTYVLALLDRVSGLELRADAPNGSWPTLQVRGGVRPYSNALIPVQDLAGNPFRAVTGIPLGQISVPGQSAPDPTETSDWSYAKLSYASQFDLTLSRLTPAALIETSVTALRLMSGTTTKRTTNGTTITETASQNILPKYVAYHTSSGYQVGTISTTPIDLSGMDEPWIMVWFGNQSHWVDTTIPTNAQTSWTFPALPQRYATQADAPILLTFSSNPTAIARDATAASGFDLTLPSGAKKIAALPLYGRTRPTTTTTETWTTVGNLPQAQIAAWYPRLGQFPASATESYSYTPGTDTATVTRTVSWTQVLASGSSKFCPIPPVVQVAADAGLAAAVTGTVVDGAIPTEYGPTAGVVGVDSVAWTLAGLAPYTEPRAALGSGAVPAERTAKLNAQVDALVAQSEWRPWFIAPRIPNVVPGGDVYWTNSADVMAIVAEIAASTSGTRRTALLSWLQAYRALRPPESGTNYNLSPTTGTARGTFATPGSMAAYWGIYLPTARFYDTRQGLFAAWAYARYYQETGDAVDSSVVTALLALVDTDLAEHDAATYCVMATAGQKQTAPENIHRLWAGLAGLAWLCAEVGDTTNEQLCRALLARVTVARVAMGHLARWQAAQGLITIPTDLGSSTANQQWNATFSSSWLGWLYVADWADSSDDPRVPVFFDQHRAWLDDHQYRVGWQEGGTRPYIPTYRSMVKPLMELLADEAPTEASVYAEKYRALNPHWSIPYADGVYGGENQFVQPADSYGLFLEHAWVEGADADTLEREAATPWLADGQDLFAIHKLAESVRAYAGDATGTEPAISDVDDNRADYSGSEVPLYSPLVVTCQVTTDAERDIYLPYDASAPHANDRNGITVDLQISTDSDFGSYETAPFCWIEDWDRQTKTYTAPNYDWSYPLGTGRWQAGWTPESSTGTYYLRIRAEDAGGVSYWYLSNVTVTTAQSGHHGGIRASSTDNRYFEHADGTYFSGVGTAFQPRLSTSDNAVNWHVPHLQQFGTNGVKWSRIWASTWGIWGDYQPEFSHARTATTAFIYTSQLNADPSYPMPSGGPEYATYVNDYNFPLWGFLHNGLSVKRSTTYRVRAEVAITGALSGPLVGGDSWGLCFKYGAPGSTFPIQQISYGGQTVWWPVKPGNGTVVGSAGGTFFHGPTTGGTWEVLDFGTFTTGSTTDFLGYFYPTVQSVGSPTQPVWIRRIWVQEDLGGGSYGPNLIGIEPSDMHKQINQRFADGFDRVVATAEQYGVVLKVVMNEKDQYWSGVMASNGNMSQPTWATDRFWGASGSRNRWLHAAIARYFQARWGYSPNVTWEFVNEGNPGLDSHHAAANDWALALATYANPKPTTTSTFGTSYRYDKWAVSPALTHGDFHGYQQEGSSLTIPTTGAAGGNSTTIATASDFYDVAGAVIRSGAIGADGSFGTGRPVVRGEMGWYPGSDANVTEPMSTAATAILLHDLLWGHLDPGGSIHHIWHTATYVYDPADNTPNNLAEFSRLATFLDAIPLNNGHYQDAAATCSNSNLRAIGQKDLTNWRAHLWIKNAGTSGNLDNTAHNWRTVNAGATPTGRTGTVSISGMGSSRAYDVTWYDPYTGDTAADSATTSSGGVLTLTLPSAVSTDLAVSVERVALPADPATSDGGGLVTGGLGSRFLAVMGFGSDPSTTSAGGSMLTFGLGDQFIVTQGFGSGGVSLPPSSDGAARRLRSLLARVLRR